MWRMKLLIDDICFKLQITNDSSETGLSRVELSLNFKRCVELSLAFKGGVELSLDFKVGVELSLDCKGGVKLSLLSREGSK